MIELVEGKGVGAGKSFYVVNRVLALLAKGGTVYASDTFQLKWDECCAYVKKHYGGVILERDQYVSFPFEDTFRLHEITPPGTPDNQVLLVIDEAQNVLNAKDHSDKSKRPFFAWLTQSRHDDNDVIFITQHSLNIDGQIRRLITFLVMVTNMWNVSIPGLGPWPQSPEWLFKRFKVDLYENSGKQRQSREWYANDPEVFACYESKSCRLAHKRAGLAIGRKTLKKEQPTQTPMTKRPLLWFALACFLFAFWRGYVSYTDFQEGRKKRQEAKQAGKPAPAKTAAEQLGTAAGVLPAETAPEVKRAQFTIEKEIFRGTDGRTFLHTDRGQYYFGALCPKGFVTKITGRVVHIRTPQGEPLFVVAEENTAIPEPKPEKPEVKEKVLAKASTAAEANAWLAPWALKKEGAK